MKKVLEVATRFRLVDRPVDARAKFRAAPEPFPPEKVELLELVPRWPVLPAVEELVE